MTRDGVGQLNTVKRDCEVAFPPRERDHFFTLGLGWRRNIGCLGLLWLVHCSPLEEEIVALPAPPADRESWEVTLELHQPGLQVSIQAPYVADDLTRQVARADSGVQVVLRRPGEDQQTLVQARRLTLEHRESRLTLGGGVRIAARDSLEAEADSLVWEGSEERLELPGALRISTPSGWEPGKKTLKPGPDLVGRVWEVWKPGDE